MHELFGPVGQIGYVVDDLEAGAQAWFDTTGIGPWSVVKHVPLDHFTYNGEDADVQFGMATAYTGGVQIELIQQHNDTPSMYRELSQTFGPGVQHVCFYPPDYDAALEHALATGFTVGQEGALAGIRFAYLRGPGGMVIELGDIPEAVRVKRDEHIAKSATWDGTNPIRVRGD